MDEGGSDRTASRRGGWRRGLRGTVWGITLAILLASSAYVYTRIGHIAASGAGGTNDSLATTNGALTTTAKPLSPATQSGPPPDPFSGTPSDAWANGAAGIVIPAAKPVGRYPASKVEYAYQATKDLLAAAALDRQTLNGGTPTAFANLLTREQRAQFVGQLGKTGVDAYGDALSSRSWIMQFAPGTARLIGPAIKVHGTMSAAATKDNAGIPVLRITIDYLVVYAVEPPNAPADWMRVVSQFDGTVDFGSWQDADTPFEPWWNAAPSVAGALCGTKDGFAHPAYQNGASGSIAPSGPPVNPYSLAKLSGGCHSATGT